eukprot:400458_1
MATKNYLTPSNGEHDAQPIHIRTRSGARGRFESASRLSHAPRQWGDNRSRYRSSVIPLNTKAKCPLLNPYGWFRIIWNALIMSMLLYSLIDVPYTLAFDIHYLGWHELVIDIIFLTDIVLTFRTATFDEYDELKLETDPKIIAKNYVLSWFVIDLLSSIPFEVLSWDEEYTTFFKFLRTLKLLRLVRLIKLVNDEKKFTVKREILVATRLLTVIGFMLLYAHLMACLWYFVGCESNKKYGTSWISEIDAIQHNCYEDVSHGLRHSELTSAFERYTYAWYWSIVTLFTTGYGDITAKNVVEQWVGSISILIGSCFFAYFIGTLTTLLGEGDGISSYKLHRMEAAQHFCERKKLPPEMAQAILTHTRYHCNYNYVFDEKEVLNTLPPYLQMDVSFYVARRLLNSLDFLDNKIVDPVIRGSIAMKMKSISCNNGYKLFQKGDIAQQIYIQRTGIATQVSKDTNRRSGYQKVQLGRGDVCGEYSLFLKRRSSTVICDTWCEFYVIDLSDIKDALRQHYESNWQNKWDKMLKFVKKSYDNRSKSIKVRSCGVMDDSKIPLEMGEKEARNMHIEVEFQPKTSVDLIHEQIFSSTESLRPSRSQLGDVTSVRSESKSKSRILSPNSLRLVRGRQNSALRDQKVKAKAEKQKKKLMQLNDITDEEHESTVNTVTPNSRSRMKYDEMKHSERSVSDDSVHSTGDTDSESSNIFKYNEVNTKTTNKLQILTVLGGNNVKKEHVESCIYNNVSELEQNDNAQQTRVEFTRIKSDDLLNNS